MNKKLRNKTILIILSIVLVIIALSTATYALFFNEQVASNPNNYNTGLLAIEAVSKSENISLISAIPQSDEEGLKNSPYVFTIKNIGNLDYNFDVKLLSTSSNTILPQYIKLQIDDGKITTLSALTSGIIKENITLKAKETMDISIKLWLSIDTPNSEIGKTFNSKIVTDGEAIYTESNYELNTVANYIKNLYSSADKTVVTNDSIEYNYAPSVNLMNDRLGGTTTSLDGGNIRYYGANPNNYIYFNCDDYTNQTSDTCELWRIIGVFEDKVKIIRNESIGKFSWDYDYNDGGGKKTYSNNWETSSLQVLLNNQYYNNVNTTYYNNNITVTAVNFNTDKTGLKNDTTRSMIAEVNYSLGGWNTSEIYSDEIYGYERGTSVYAGNPTSWTGKIALMYPSDYGYAMDFTKCSQNLINYGNSTDLYVCGSNDWLYDNSVGKSLLATDSDNSRGAWYVMRGHVDIGYAMYGYNVHPVLYLNSELVIVSENAGSSSDPYRISIINS